MRKLRLKAVGNSEVAYYHCFSRVADGRTPFGDEEKEHFLKIMRGYELFCGVRVVTYCIMDGHFNLLVEVPHRPDPKCLPDNRELLRRLGRSDFFHWSPELKQILARMPQSNQDRETEQVKEKFFSRMWDVSWFMRLLKQRFTQWFNSRTSRNGTLWEGNFRSLLVEGTGPALMTIAAYIDLEPVRLKKVTNPQEYRWSGYSEAVQGGKLARKGLQKAVEAWRRRRVSPRKVIADYDSFLLGREKILSEESGERPRKYVSSRTKEKVELSEALRSPVRAFSKGVVFGSRAFVEEFFLSHREQFSPGRKEGARKLEGINAPGLFVARTLKERSRTPSADHPDIERGANS